MQAHTVDPTYLIFGLFNVRFIFLGKYVAKEVSCWRFVVGDGALGVAGTTTETQLERSTPFHYHVDGVLECAVVQPFTSHGYYTVAYFDDPSSFGSEHFPRACAT